MYTLFAQGYTGYHFLLFQIVFDPFFTIITLVLFLRPLYRLLVISKKHNGTLTHKTKRTMRLMIKYTMLTAIVLISSSILLSLVVFFGIGAEFAAFDNFLNCYC